MRTSIWKAYYNEEKEEQWLQEMAAQGQALIHYKWVHYVFEPCEPGEYLYRVEFLEHMAYRPESRLYLQFLEDMDIECVGTWMHWAVLRKKNSGEPFQILTDYDSRIRQCRKACHWYMVFFLFELAILLLEAWVGLYDYFVYGDFSLVFPLCVLIILLFVLGIGNQYRRLRRTLKRYQREKAIFEA